MHWLQRYKHFSKGLGLGAPLTLGQSLSLSVIHFPWVIAVSLPFVLFIYTLDLTPSFPTLLVSNHQVLINHPSPSFHTDTPLSFPFLGAKINKLKGRNQIK